MSFILVFGLLVAGIILLMVGAEVLVRGAGDITSSLGVSPLVVGLTIVSYGTSSPEMAVAIQSSLAGQADLALGNVIGSNIFNILVILGISSLTIPLIVARQLTRLDVPIMIGVSILTFFFGLDRTIHRSDGIILLIGGIVYTAFLIYKGAKESSNSNANSNENVEADAIKYDAVVLGDADKSLSSKAEHTILIIDDEIDQNYVHLFNFY